MGEKQRDRDTRSRSRSKRRRRADTDTEEEDYKHVPANYEEFRAVCLNFICSPSFVYPMHGHDIIKAIKYEYKDEDLREVYKPKTADYHQYMQRIINELYQIKAIDLEEWAVGASQMLYINEINMDKLQQLRREYVKDMPRKKEERKQNRKGKEEEVDYSKKFKDLLLSIKSNHDQESGKVEEEETKQKKGRKKIRFDFCTYNTREKCMGAQMA